MPEIPLNPQVARFIGREFRVDLLNAQRPRDERQTKIGLVHDEPVVEWPARSITARLDHEARRSELHLGDGIVAVAPARCGSQAGDEPGSDLRQHSFSASGLAASERVSERVTALIVSGETTGGKLATWTKGLAIATLILASATIALVVVEALKH